MYKQILRLMTICVVFISLIFMLNGVAAAKKVLKIQLVYPKTSSVAVNSLFFADKVEKLTNGEIKIKIFYPGQLVKAKEGLTALHITGNWTCISYAFSGNSFVASQSYDELKSFPINFLIFS